MDACADKAIAAYHHALRDADDGKPATSPIRRPPPNAPVRDAGDSEQTARLQTAYQAALSRITPPSVHGQRTGPRPRDHPREPDRHVLRPRAAQPGAVDQIRRGSPDRGRAAPGDDAGTRLPETREERSSPADGHDYPVSGKPATPSRPARPVTGWACGASTQLTSPRSGSARSQDMSSLRRHGALSRIAVTDAHLGRAGAIPATQPQASPLSGTGRQRVLADHSNRPADGNHELPTTARPITSCDFMEGNGHSRAAVMIGRSGVKWPLSLRPEVVVMAPGGQDAGPGPGMPGAPVRPPGWRRRGCGCGPSVRGLPAMGTFGRVVPVAE